MNGSKDLGKTFTIINGKPYKFQILGESVDYGTEDPLDNWQYILKFFDCLIIRDLKPINFVVNPISTLMPRSSKHKDEIIDSAITFGIQKIKEFPEYKQFDFLSADFENLKKFPKINGRELRLEILKFIYEINNILPSENVSVDDLMFNINGNQNEIEQWLDNLAKQEYLSPIIKSIPMRGTGGTKNASFYSINPQKLYLIESELSDHAIFPKDSILKIFISYNSKDKSLAGAIKKSLTKPNQEIFLAHEDIMVTKPWEQEIIRNLKECQIFIPIITENFHLSERTDQETGYAIQGALNNKKFIISVFKGIHPYGFINLFQGIPMANKELETIGQEIQLIIDTLKSQNS
jgi:hypothetical protein